MFGKILLPVRTRRAIRKGERVQSVGYAESIQIGLVFRYISDEHHEQVLELVKKLENDGKGVSMLGYIARKETEPGYRFPHFRTTNLSAWGKLTSEEIDVFLQKNFDFLIDLDIEPDSFVDNILSRSKARCKIGLYQSQRAAFYQLMINIDPADDFGLFLEKVYFYIKNLRANV